jgi:hypothetical protein
MSDAFDPPDGDPDALAAAARGLGGIGAQLHQDAAAGRTATGTAVSTWRGARAADFGTACFGIQLGLATVAGTTDTAAQLLTAYATKLAAVRDEVAGLKARHDQVAAAADREAALVPDTQADRLDAVYRHAAMQQADLARQALEAKAGLRPLAGRLAAAIDAQTDLIVPGGSGFDPEDIRLAVDADHGLVGLRGTPADRAGTDAQAWRILDSGALWTAKQVLDVQPDNRDGELAGGPVTWFSTDPALLQEMLDDARAAGVPPSRYSALLWQYWTVQASNRAGIPLDAWDPAKGTDGNRATISAVYSFYADLYLSDEDLQWAGMANMIGPSFAAGFLDLDTFKDIAKSLQDGVDQVPGPLRGLLPADLLAAAKLGDLSAEEFRWYEQKFLAMQKHIFFDQATMHAAYTTPGQFGRMTAIDEMWAAGLIDTKARNAWKLIDGGDPIEVSLGNRDLLDREQNQVIAKQYDEMRSHDWAVGPAMTYVMTVVGSASIPGTKTPAEFSPLTVSGDADIPLGPFVHENVEVTISTPLPSFNISDRQARWDYVQNDTLPAYQRLLAEHPELARAIISSPVDDRIEQQRIVHRVDDLAGHLVTDWGIDVDGDLGVGFPW